METDFAKVFGDRPLALDDGGGVLDARGLDAVAASFGRHVPPRALVFLLADNTVGALAGLLACLRRRAVPLLLGASTDRGFVDRLLERYESPFLWLPEAIADSFEGEHLYAAMGYCLVRRPVEGPEPHPGLSLLLPTSGSTGSPKLVRHSYGNLSSSARNVARLFALEPTDRPVAGLPLHFTMGLSVVTSHLHVGATVLLARATVTEARFWTFLKEQRASSFTGVPYSYEMLHRLRFSRMDLPDLQVLSQGGGKLREPVFRALAKHAQESGRRFFATYGQTEGTARMACLPPKHACERTGSIGWAVPEGRLSLIDEEGVEQTAPEAAGELVYAGPNVTMGYALERSDLAMGDERGGVLHTGDLARRDADGFYYVIGRKNRFLKLFGLRIGLDEVEELVKRAFPGECVAGGDDTRLRILVEKPESVGPVKAFVCGKTGLFHGAVEVAFHPRFERNEAGKVIFPQAFR